MANSKNKTQQKAQADDPQVIEAERVEVSQAEDPQALKVEETQSEETDPEANQDESKDQQSREDEKKRDADEPTPVVSFQDLDEPDENLPGVVAPKKEN